MKHQRSSITLTTLTVGAELVATIIRGVAGNEISDNMNGSELTRSAINNLVQAGFQKQLSNHLGK